MLLTAFDVAMRTLFFACTAIFASSLSLTSQRCTENVVLVTLDGLRWQDVFGGADNRMLNKEDG